MGKATTWLKGLFGMNKKKGKMENSNSKDKKDQSSFSKTERDTTRGLCHNPTTIPPNITPAEAAWLRSFYEEQPAKDEQNKHAIAVAAATAAAADAAVAAAQAAVAVVRLTSQGRGTMFNGGREKWAAVMIQTCFRGYLARKALRALKGLVKLQAHVRGYLVRKQAYATLHSMEALLRAQLSVRAQKTRGLIFNDENCPLLFRPRKSVERFDDSRNECRMARHRRRLSASLETHMKDFDEIPKIVEVDTGNIKPKYSRSRRTNTWMNEYGDINESYGQTTSSSPLPSRINATRFSNGRSSHDPESGLAGDEYLYRISTAQSTPRFANPRGSNAPVTPAKSVCEDCYFRNYENYPNYMANTKSFNAKLRSQSAPKQRPESMSKRRLSLNEMMESRNSLSGVRMQRSCSQAQEVISFKNAVMDNLNRSSGFVREQDRDYYMQ